MISLRRSRTAFLSVLAVVFMAASLAFSEDEVELLLKLELAKEQIFAGEPVFFTVSLKNGGAEILLREIPFQAISTAVSIIYNRGAEAPRRVLWPPEGSASHGEKYVPFAEDETRTLKGLIYFDYDPESPGYPFSQPDFYTLKAVLEVTCKLGETVRTKELESNFVTLLVKPTPPTEREILELIDPESFDYHLREGSIEQKASKVEIREDEPFGAFVQRRADYPSFEEIDVTFQRNRLAPYIKFGLMKAYSKAGKPRQSIAAASRLIVYAGDFLMMEEVYHYLLKAYRETGQQASANTYERFLREEYPEYYKTLLERGEL